MEYGWKCFFEQRFIMKSRMCRITVIVSYFILFTILTLSVAVYSYAAENLSLKQAVGARPTIRSWCSKQS